MGLVLLCYFDYISNLVKKKLGLQCSHEGQPKAMKPRSRGRMEPTDSQKKKLKLANQGRNKGFICKAMCTKQNKTGRHLAATLRRDRLHFGIGLSASNFKVFDIHVEDNKVLIVLHGIGNPAQIQAAVHTIP